MRQGNDIGTQYRSAIFVNDAATLAAVEASRNAILATVPCGRAGAVRSQRGNRSAGAYYLAEDDHQQYLHKNPGGYCGLRGTGVACPA